MNDIRQKLPLDDLNTIIASCSTDKIMREQCKKLSFWKPIFERKNLILPYAVYTIKDWIKLYNISVIITPLIDYGQFSICINNYDELADIDIIGDIKLLNLRNIFPLNFKDIDNTYHLYKYLLQNTDLPQYDIISVVYDQLYDYDVDLMTFYFDDDLNQWEIVIHYEEDSISLMMNPKDFYLSICKLLQKSKFQQINFHYETDESFIYL